MREALKTLIDSTIVFKYRLPYGEQDKTKLSTEFDMCLSVLSDEMLAQLIYNGIADYAIGEKHVDIANLQLCQRKAIKSRLRFEDDNSQDVKLKYGFYGEVVLDLVLQQFFSTNVLLAKGYFYNPLENSETKGYDAYHFCYNDGQLSLLLGEAKFYGKFSNAIKKILDNIEKAASENYFNKNVLALINEKENFESVPEAIINIIDQWEQNPDINLYDEITRHNIKLCYPMLVLYDSTDDTYDTVIKRSVQKIDDELSKRNISIDIDLELCFIFIPVDNAKNIKEEVISCISENKPLL